MKKLRAQFGLRFLLLFTLTPLANAAPKSPEIKNYCGDLRKSTQLVDRCDRNKYLADLGLRCAVKLNAASSEAAAALQRDLSTSTDSQKGAMAASAANLAKADAKLANLDLKSEAAIEDNLRLFLNLVHPDELYEVSSGQDPNAFLRGSPCFRENKRKLLISLTEIEHNRNGLLRAREALKTLNGRTSKEIGELLQAALRPVRSNPTSGKSAPQAFPNRKHPKSNSDITGTKPKGGGQ